MTKPTHYLRFVQAIVLAAAVPACSTSTSPESSTSSPKEDKTEQASERPEQTEQSPAEPAATVETEADAGADATLPFSSGPQMPPVFA